MLDAYLSQRLDGFVKQLQAISATLVVFNPRLEISAAMRPGAPNVIERSRSLRFADKDLGSLHLVLPSKTPHNAEAITEQMEAFSLQLAALLSTPHPSSAIELDQAMDKLSRSNARFHWCGVYRIEGEKLALAAFRGAATPHAVIDRNHGICGAAVRENRTLNIADVNEDPRYLSCDIRTRAEVVVPIRNQAGEPIGEIDIDSHSVGAFSPSELFELEELAGELSKLMLK